MKIDKNYMGLLKKYESKIAKTDKFSNEKDITPILLGFYGEIGSIMSASKKYLREKEIYAGYKESLEEEFGDALWYFAAICRRIEVSLEDIFDIKRCNSQAKDEKKFNNYLINLGCIAASLLELDQNTEEFKDKLYDFAPFYIQAIQSAELYFATIVERNMQKVLERFSEPDMQTLPNFDGDFPAEEQIPKQFEIHFFQRKSRQCHLRWNGVFIGAPLTDNIESSDDYRFHDVFHLAHAAILHWSPTFRALIKHKRKSDSEFDENQDGGRAIVIEEGLTAWLFSYSKDLDYFKGNKELSFDVLKTIQRFVRGYEVEKCPLKLWENAILEGYSVFRKIRENNGGIVIGDREKRTISYRSIGDEK